MHTSNQNSNNIWQNNIAEMVSLIRSNTKKDSRKENLQTDSIMFRIILMLHTKMLECIVTQINTKKLPFCGPHYKPHGARWMSKHYHFRFGQKLGNSVCAIFLIPCACVACTSILDKPWISGIPSDKQERYKPITNCTY